MFEFFRNILDFLLNPFTTIATAIQLCLTLVSAVGGVFATFAAMFNFFPSGLGSLLSVFVVLVIGGIVISLLRDFL